MKTRIFLFFVFILILFFIFSRIQFSSDIPSSKGQPDFILENSEAKHFVKGNLSFKVNARRIEIFKRKFLLYDATINFNNGVTIRSKKMEADLKKSKLIAKQNVRVNAKNLHYFGDEIVYHIKEKKFFGYNGGRIILKNKDKEF